LHIITLLDKVFKALADPTRRRVLDRLFENNGQSLKSLCEALDMTRQAVTQHIDLLVRAGLVVAVWHGREKLHYLNPVPIYEIQERWVDKFDEQRARTLAELKRGLENNGKT